MNSATSSPALRQAALENVQLPQHIAIIMDGNGRWATRQGLPRVAGYQAGIQALRGIVAYAVSYGIRFLTVYAFSSENWQRPQEEVNHIMDLFFNALRVEIKELHENNVRLFFVGDRDSLPGHLQSAITEAEKLTRANQGLGLNIAVAYGGRWDILQACRKLVCRYRDDPSPKLDQDAIAAELMLADCPDPELLIRPGGERRISNFLLWQLAYAELYFSDVLWPDFTDDEMDTAMLWYIKRQRRFGQTSEQLG